MLCNNSPFESGSATNVDKNCPLVESLNEQKRATVSQTTSLTARIFAVLFPGSPAVNALLATLYISGPPSMLSRFNARCKTN